MSKKTRLPGARALLQRMLLRRAVAARSRGGDEAFPKLLYTKPAVTPERTLAVRAMIVLGLLLIVVVAIERAGRIHGFWDHPDEVIQGGDLVFAIEPHEPARG